MEAYLCGRDSPDLVVVGPHELIGNADTDISHDPVIEVFGLGVGHASLEGGVDQAVHGLGLIFFGQHGDVVLVWVGDPLALVSHIGDTLVGIPVGVLRESLVDAVIEVLVVGEDDVATDIVELEKWLLEIFK